MASFGFETHTVPLETQHKLTGSGAGSGSHIPEAPLCWMGLGLGGPAGDVLHAEQRCVTPASGSAVRDSGLDADGDRCASPAQDMRLSLLWAGPLSGAQ
ncbi:hypothetical protein GGI07_001226 [Coemansia sp. Benny D115]|nr:hypothetical protein GGI07_001226 [Coemansia sp. Benny D115]